MALTYEAKGQRFVTPVTFDALFDELDKHPDARLVVGGTDLSLEVTKRFAVLPKLVSLEGLAPLKVLEETDAGFRVGAGVTVSDLEVFSATRLPSLHRMVRYFGARQIKHRGTVGGNLCTASPIGDLAPALISLGASAVIRGRAGERAVALEDFFVGYRKTALRAGEVLAAVLVPRVPASARAASYKVSKRRELDISTVSAGLYVDVDAGSVVTTARLAFGGMAATPKRAAAAEAALVGKPWSVEAAEAAAQALAKDFTPLSDHRGSKEYRALVAANLLRGFFEETRDVKQPMLAPGHAATVLASEGGSRA
jgi:xanthine dehydrogenase small subunit